MGRLVGLSAREVYYIEIGRIPDHLVVDRLKLLLMLSPVILVLSAIAQDIVTWVRLKKTWISRSLQGRVDKTGQSRLPLQW